MRRRAFFCLLGVGVASGLAVGWTGAQPAPRRVGGGCDGCEAIYDGLPQELSSSAELAPATEPGERLEIRGTVFRVDGVTPAAGVVLYLWQTNAQGRYVPAPGQKGEAARHGRLRAWLRTGANGEYRISSIRPGSYPGQDIPAHVHLVVKEADKNEYYLDDFLFEGDPLLTPAKRAALENRGGSGILRLRKVSDRWLGNRDLVLGRNIPNY